MILDLLLGRLLRFQSETRTFSLQKFASYMDQWIDGGYKTSSGIQLSTDGALAVAAVYACTRKLAEGVSTLPLILYQRVAKDGKKRATNHPLYPLLRYSPTPEISAWEFWDYIIQSAVLRGNAYARIIRNRRGVITKLIPYHPDRMEPKVENGTLYYEFSRNDGSKERIDLDQLFRVRGPLSKDGVTGLNIVEQLCEVFGHARALDDYSSKMFSKGARLSGVLQYPRRFADRSVQERLVESWNRMISGPDNAYKVAILEDGMTFQQISMTAEDAQLLEARKFSVEEICRVFGVPPHKIGHLDKATFSNIEHQDLEWVRDSIRPWLIRIEQSIYRDLFTEEEKRSDKLFAEFLVDGLLRGDTATRNQSYATGRQWGWLSINDIRRLENMNPIAKGGDDYLMPVNMKVIGEPEKPESPQAPIPAGPGNTPAIQPATSAEAEEESSASLVSSPAIADTPPDVEVRFLELDVYNRLTSSIRRLFYEGMGRVIRKEINAVERLFKKGLPDSEWRERLKEFYLDHREFVFQIVNPILSAYAETRFGICSDQTEMYIREFCERYCDRNCTEYMENNVSDIILSWKNDRISDIFVEEMNNFSTFLLEKITQNKQGGQADATSETK